MHYNLVYAQKLGYSGMMLGGGNDKVDSSKTLGSVNNGQSSRQFSLTQHAGCFRIISASEED
jgi:hypothetical protein